MKCSPCKPLFTKSQEPSSVPILAPGEFPTYSESAQDRADALSRRRLQSQLGDEFFIESCTIPKLGSQLFSKTQSFEVSLSHPDI